MNHRRTGKTAVIHANGVEELFGGGWTRQKDEDGRVVCDPATCGTCGRTWNDARVSGVTPTPSARCPFEYDHDEALDGSEVNEDEDPDHDPTPYETGEPDNLPREAQERAAESLRLKR